MTLKTVTVDGIPVEVTDQGATVITTLQSRLVDANTKLSDADKAHQAAIVAKDEEIGTLKADLKKAQDAAIKPEDLDRMVADRSALANIVRSIDSKIEIKGSDADLRRAAVSAKLGADMVKDSSDAEVAGMFKAIAKDVKPADPFAQAVAGGVQTVGDAHTLADNAWGKSVADLNAWRKEA